VFLERGGGKATDWVSTKCVNRHNWKTWERKEGNKGDREHGQGGKGGGYKPGEKRLQGGYLLPEGEHLEEKGRGLPVNLKEMKGTGEGI